MGICGAGSEWMWKEQIKFDSAVTKVRKTAQASDIYLSLFTTFFESSRSLDVLTCSFALPVEFALNVNFEWVYFQIKTAAMCSRFAGHASPLFNPDPPVKALLFSDMMPAHSERKGGAERVFREYWSLHHCNLWSSSSVRGLHGCNGDRR